jgi:predicted Zn-dependent protease
MLRQLLLCAALASALPAADPIQKAFERLYNFDFPGAHAILDRHLAQHPEDAMGYSVRAGVYLFSELDRLGIMEAEFFTDDRRIADDKKKLKPDAGVRTRFFQAVETARSRAQSTLATRPDDANALCASCWVQGMIVDYTALIDKKQIAALSLAKKSNACAQRLIKAHPEMHDAYVTVGFTEYLVGSLPFFVRWFVRFEGVEGNKQTGIQIVQKAAQSARYLGPFAKILLSVAYLREKKPQESHRLLTEFNRDYPENQLVRRELAKLSSRVGHGSGLSAP